MKSLFYLPHERIRAGTSCKFYRCSFRKSIVSKILDIQKLKENDRQHVFALLDVFLKQAKSKHYVKKPRILRGFLFTKERARHSYHPR